MRVAVVGASGFLGGELLRLLLGHPYAAVVAAVSRRLPGRRVDGPHPHLRGQTDLRFCSPDDVADCDAVILATPHGRTAELVDSWRVRAKVVIDLSADLRLHSAASYREYYGIEHAHPELLGTATAGWPERHRAKLAGADLISVPGCGANAAILALYPLAAEGLVEPAVTVDARVGSSGSGRDAGLAGQHAVRSGAMRVFAPHGHRHEAEVAQATGLSVTMSATAVEAVRGVQVLCRATLREALDEISLRRLYRRYYDAEPFVRVVAQRRGVHRLPEPKMLSGTNFCDVGFSLGADGRGVVLVAALDNLVKGGAGNAVQCLNIRAGWPERTGLEFGGLYPI
jgi:LysW-gamma-L-alpha-aminoadipyl-6-phosphate/LysW-L-glutamyl-5-phosphate reductase